MNIDKHKIVFIGILLLLVSFIIAYALWGLEEEEDPDKKMINPEVPALVGEPQEYQSRMEAVDGLREERNQTPPSLYPDTDLGESQNYDPYLDEKEKQILVDSILQSGPEPETYHFAYPDASRQEKDTSTKDTLPELLDQPAILPGQGHLAFFFTSKEATKQPKPENQTGFLASVNGDQVVRKDQRLELRVMEQAVFTGDTLAANTLIYARCSFRANRLLLDIAGNAIPGGRLVAFDLSDGLEGIYIENSFRSQATTEVLDDVIQDINISGVPQVRGLKGIFQRSNRYVKVKVLHQHQLILKPVL